MANKTKIQSQPTYSLADIGRQAGMLLMSAVVTVGMLELPDRASRIIVPTQPVFAWANENQQPTNQTTLRRASEETEQHYVSYSVAQRTPSRSGRH